MCLIIIASLVFHTTSNIKILKFNKTEYESYINSFPKNNFLITLEISNLSEYQFYFNQFSDICKYISSYNAENINITFSILYNPEQKPKTKKDTSIYVYLPGMSEIEIKYDSQRSSVYNSKKILSSCLTLAKKLHKLEKIQKSQELNRIKNELHEIALKLKDIPLNEPRRKILIKDYTDLIDDLIKYIPKGKQNKKRLKLLLQIYPNGNSETKKLQKIIKESKEKMNQREKELSSQKNDEKQRKKIIKALRTSLL